MSWSLFLLLQAPLLLHRALKEAGRTAQVCVVTRTVNPVQEDFTVILQDSLNPPDPALLGKTKID